MKLNQVPSASPAGPCQECVPLPVSAVCRLTSVSPLGLCVSGVYHLQSGFDSARVWCVLCRENVMRACEILSTWSLRMVNEWYRRFPSLSPAAPRVAGPVAMMGVAIQTLGGARAVSGRSLWASAQRSGTVSVRCGACRVVPRVVRTKLRRGRQQGLDEHRSRRTVGRAGVSSILSMKTDSSNL